MTAVIFQWMLSIYIPEIFIDLSLYSICMYIHMVGRASALESRWEDMITMGRRRNKGEMIISRRTPLSAETYWSGVLERVNKTIRTQVAMDIPASMCSLTCHKSVVTQANIYFFRYGYMRTSWNHSYQISLSCLRTFFTILKHLPVAPTAVGDLPSFSLHIYVQDAVHEYRKNDGWPKGVWSCTTTVGRSGERAKVDDERRNIIRRRNWCGDASGFANARRSPAEDCLQRDRATS